MFSSIKINLFLIFSIILLIQYINSKKCLEPGQEGCDDKINKCCYNQKCIKINNGKTKCCIKNNEQRLCLPSKDDCCSPGKCVTSYPGNYHGNCIE
jgi:hypothetical protein